MRSISKVFKLKSSKAIALLAFGYIIYPQFNTKIELYYKSSNYFERILARCPSLSSGFQPCPWLFNGILQAVYGGTKGSQPNIEGNEDYIKYIRQEIIMSDNGVTSIDWKLPANVKPDSKILLIAPGLTGHSGSHYIRTAVKEATSKGYRVGVIHGRGIGGTPLKVFYS